MNWQKRDASTGSRSEGKPIPLLMVLRGFLPNWLGGEMVYNAVVRTNHFDDKKQLANYLLRQHLVAIAQGRHDHADAIHGHLLVLRGKQ